MVKKKPAAQAKTAENETVKVETKAAEKTTAAEKEAVKEVGKEVVKETAAAEEAPAKAEEKPAAKAVAKQEVPVSDNTQIIAVITAAIAAQMEAETGVCVPADGLVIRSIKKRTFN